MLRGKTGEWFRGKVNALNDGYADILYDDGDTANELLYGDGGTANELLTQWRYANKER